MTKAGKRSAKRAGDGAGRRTSDRTGKPVGERGRGGWASRSAARPTVRTVLIAMLITGVLVAVLGALTGLLQEPLLVPPFATSAAIIACLPQSPVAQPRNVVGGHLLCALAAYATMAFEFGPIPDVSIAVTLGVGAMLAARMLHPPGGATAAIVVLEAPSFVAFLVVLALASLLIILVGVLSSRASRTFSYPTYWW